MTLTRYGLREWGLGLIAALLFSAGFIALLGYGHPAVGTAGLIAVWILWFAVALFFRNPRRKCPEDGNVLLSPADGTVRDIAEVDFDMAPFHGRAMRVGIFLSVLNVHVNRAPAKWHIENSSYREGRYLDARNPNCAKENEAMTISGTAEAGGITFPLAVRQISGAIARRIVCPVIPGRTLSKGAVYGMIKFGSRTEIYFPADKADVQVRIGDKVRGGQDVIARIR